MKRQSINENTNFHQENEESLHNRFPYFRHTIQRSKAVVITVIVIRVLSSS